MEDVTFCTLPPKLLDTKSLRLSKSEENFFENGTSSSAAAAASVAATVAKKASEEDEVVVNGTPVKFDANLANALAKELCQNAKFAIDSPDDVWSQDDDEISAQVRAFGRHLPFSS